MKRILSFLFAVCISLMVSANTAGGIKASQMHYSQLVGQGSDTVSIIFYCPTSDEYNAFMWGFLFDDNDNTYVSDVLSALATEAGVELEGLEMGYISKIKWANNVLSFEGASNNPTGYYWMYNVNDKFADAVSTQKIHANDVINFQFTNDFESPLYTYEGLLEKWISVYPVLDPEYHPLPTVGNITYYVGEGEKSAALIVYCPNAEGAMATVWGYHFNGEAVVADMLNAISSADKRLVLNGMDYGYISSVAFADDFQSYNTAGEQALQNTYWMYNLNDVYAPKGVSQMPLNDKDVVVLQYAAQASTLAELQGQWLTYMADDPNFRGSDLFATHYNVGEGTAFATLTINYPSSGKALTWGYKFNDNGEVMVSDMLEDIDTADPRLTISGVSMGFIMDIAYSGTEAKFDNTSYNWMFTVNDREAPYGVNQVPLHDGYAVYFEYTGGAWPYTLKKLAELGESVAYVENPNTGTALNAADAVAPMVYAQGRLAANTTGMLRIFAATGQNVLNANVEAGQMLQLNLPAGIYTAKLNGAAIKFVVR